MEDDPAYDIAIVRVGSSTGGGAIADAPLREAVKATLRRHDMPTAQITVALTDDPGIAELNERHLGHDGPTDVLAFDLRDGDPDSPPTSRLEGDIVISVDAAAREACSRGCRVDAEAALYAVHGVLHLLGYRDDRERNAACMHAMEDEILSSLGMGSVFGAQPQ